MTTQGAQGQSQRRWRSASAKPRLERGRERPTLLQEAAKSSPRRLGMLLEWCGLSLPELHAQCQRSIPMIRLYQIIRGTRHPSLFERKALVHALCRVLEGRMEVLFQSFSRSTAPVGELEEAPADPAGSKVRRPSGLRAVVNSPAKLRQTR